MPRPQGFCVYCGGAGLTREHVIANWTARFLHKNITEHGKLSVQIDNPGLKQREKVLSNIKKISGDPRSRSVRRVCAKCNGGWMRDQQDRAKPLAAPMILGRPTELTRDDQRTLAVWVLMTVMTSEFSDAEFAAIPQSDRSFLRTFQAPPNNWKILIGNYPDGMTKPYLHHESAQMTYEGAESYDALDTQATTYTVGHIYVHAVSSRHREFVDGVRIDLWGANRLEQLWPVIHTPLNWPPLLRLTEQDAESIPGTLYGFAASLNKRGATLPTSA